MNRHLVLLLADQGHDKANHAPETEFLGQVTVRLIADEERDRFDELLERSIISRAPGWGGKACVTWPKPMANGWR